MEGKGRSSQWAKKSAALTCANVKAKQKSSKESGSRKIDVGNYNGSQLAMSSFSDMYRVAGVSTYHESKRRERTLLRPTYSDSALHKSHVKCSNPVEWKPRPQHGSGAYSDSILSSNQRSNTLFLTEYAARTIERAKSVYLNKSFRNKRVETLSDKILSLHKAKMKKDISEATRRINKRTENNISHLQELCDVRDKFFKEKKSRLNRTYVSLTAIDMPEVSRYAYGLPPVGQEFSFIKNPDPAKTKEKYQGLWKKTMKKATNAIKILKTDSISEEEMLPNIVVRKKPSQNNAKSNRKIVQIEGIGEKSMDVTGMKLDNLLEEIEAVSPVSSVGDLDTDSLLESDEDNY